MMTWRHPVGVSQILWIWTTLDGSMLGAAHPGSMDPGVSLSSTLQLSYYSVRARALQRALCAHVSQHDSTGVLHPSGMSHPDTYSRPYHPITRSGWPYAVPQHYTSHRSSAEPLKRDASSYELSVCWHLTSAAEALRDLVPGDLQHPTSRDPLVLRP